MTRSHRGMTARTPLMMFAAAAGAMLFLSAVAPRAVAEEPAAQPAPAKSAPAKSAPAKAAPAKRERKKIQEVDLKRLEIQGRIEDPASVFVVETGRLLLPGLDVLKGIFPSNALVPVEKTAMDRDVTERIESAMGVVKR